MTPELIAVFRGKGPHLPAVIRNVAGVAAKRAGKIGLEEHVMLPRQVPVAQVATRVSETHYAARVDGGLYLAALLSFANNPGFKRDRGPVVVPGFRVHVDF